MVPEHRIGMLWVEGPLSYVEVLCAKSFVDAGHHVELFHYGPVQNVPEGVECVDGTSVLDIDKFVRHEKTGSLALFSDVFRYHLLAKRDRTIWADLDAYCVKPFETPTGHFFGWESEGSLNGGVLGLPQDSEGLGRLLEMTEDEYTIPPWVPLKKRKELEARATAGDQPHVAEMPWGVWGPRALTAILGQTGEVKYALPRAGLYPVSFRDRRKVVRSGGKRAVEAMMNDGTYSVHFYGRRISEILHNVGGAPEKGSFLDGLLQKHRVDMAAAPLRPQRARQTSVRVKLTAPDRSADPFSVLSNLHGAHMSADQLRYGEAYHLLMSPFRRRSTAALVVVQPGHAGLGEAAESALERCLATWRDYLPKAQINCLVPTGLEVQSEARTSVSVYDPDNSRTLTETVADIAQAPQIVVHLGGGGSQLQQELFLDVFPILNSNGVYIFEGLHWQPRVLEKRGFTKTAALLRGFQVAGQFSHKEPEIGERFDALRDRIGACIVLPAKYRADTRDQLGIIHKL